MPDAPEPATAPRSTIAVPVRITPDFLRRRLDELLDGLHPEAPGLLYRDPDLDLGHGLRGDVRVHRRGPTAVHMAADTVHASLPVRVTIRPAWSPPGVARWLALPSPVPLAADYTVRMRAYPRLDPDYNLRLDAAFEHRVDRSVGFGALGMRLSFPDATRAAAEEALSALAGWLNSDDFRHLSFRTEAERGWQALQAPVTLSAGHHLRLAVAPEEVRARPFRTQDGDGFLTLAITARLHGTAGEAGPHAPVPLPTLSPGAPASGISLALPLSVSFVALEAALRDNVLRHPWRIEHREVTVHEIAAAGADDGSLQVQVGISVTTEGHAYDVQATLSARGRPRLDVDGQHLALEDFRYDVETDRTLLNIAATLLRPFAGAILQPWLSLPLQPQAQRLLDEVNQRLERGIRLAGDVALHGRVLGIRLSGLQVDSAGLRATLETHGELSVTVG